MLLVGFSVSTVVIRGNDTGILDTGRWLLDAGYLILDTGCWILDTDYWILDTGCWFLDTGYWIFDPGFQITKRQITDDKQIANTNYQMTDA